MTPTRLMIILKRARYWSSGRVQKGLENAHGGEEGDRGREHRELTGSLTAAPHIRKMTEKKWFYLSAVSFHISSQQHSSISVISQGLQTCLAILSAELYFNTRMEGGEIAHVRSDLCLASLRHRPHPAPWCPHSHILLGVRFLLPCSHQSGST